MERGNDGRGESSNKTPSNSPTTGGGSLRSKEKEKVVSLGTRIRHNLHQRQYEPVDSGLR